MDVKDKVVVVLRRQPGFGARRAEGTQDQG